MTHDEYTAELAILAETLQASAARLATLTQKLADDIQKLDEASYEILQKMKNKSEMALLTNGYHCIGNGLIIWDSKTIIEEQKVWKSLYEDDQEEEINFSTRNFWVTGENEEFEPTGFFNFTRAYYYALGQ